MISFPFVDPHAVKPDLARLQPYPFEKLRQLFAAVAPAPTFSEIKLSIGEPHHATPAFIKQALADNLAGLASYPTTQGTDALRQAILAWIGRRAARQFHRQERRSHAELRQYRRLCGRRHHGRCLGHRGFCVQIGKNVHLSGGVGIGGMLEPLQANPTIVKRVDAQTRAKTGINELLRD